MKKFAMFAGRWCFYPVVRSMRRTAVHIDNPEAIDSRRAERGSLLGARREAPDLPIDARRARVRSAVHHERRRIQRTHGIHRQGRDHLRIFLRRQQAHHLRVDARKRALACPPARGSQPRLRLGGVIPASTFISPRRRLEREIQKKLTARPAYAPKAPSIGRSRKSSLHFARVGDLDCGRMNEDGKPPKSGSRRSEGYDGGAVYSRDGSKIVVARHSPGPRLKSWPIIAGC